MKRSLFKEISERLQTIGEDKKIPSFLSGLKTEPHSLPVIAVSSRSEWEKLGSPSRLVKSFQFSSFESQKFFLNELLDYQDQMNHHADIFISENLVRIDVYTRDLNCITELDYELSKVVDMIFRDSQGIS